MQSLALALKTKGPEGEPLPVVFHQLSDLRATPRRGQVTMVAAAPGGGKSAWATYLSLMMRWPDGRPVGVLYFSADSDRMTYAIRAASSAFDVHTTDSEEAILAGDPDFLAQLHDHTGHIWINFDSSPSPKDIDEETEVYALINGDYPEMVVIDNLMDVNVGGGRDHEADDTVVDFCKGLARRTSSAVIILLHVTGTYTDGNTPIPRSGIMNKLDKRPRLIYTLHNISRNLLGVSVVKNSNGPAGADGIEVVAEIPVIWEKVWFGRGN